MLGFVILLDMKPYEALLVIDYINEITNPKGKIAKNRGYTIFLNEHNTIANLNCLIEEYATNKSLVVFVNLAFKNDWIDQPKHSKIFGKAHELGILQEETWSTAILNNIIVPNNAILIKKKRVSAFYETSLESLLRDHGITTVGIVGVATDLAVEAAARDAHDRDFRVKVYARACGAATIDDHQKSLATIRKFAEVID